jgi:hypothetical protein
MRLFIINARGSLHMRRELLSALLVALGMTLAGAQQSHEFRQGCIASLPLVLDNATLHRQVHMAMNQNVTAWNYSKDPASNGTHHCARVSYNAQAEAFYNYPMQVEMSVCLADEVVVQTVWINMYMLRLNCTSRNEIGENQMRIQSDIYFGIPWFLEIMNDYIIKCITAQLRLNFVAWFEITCSQAHGIIQLSTPENKPVPEAPSGISAESLFNELF